MSAFSEFQEWVQEGVQEAGGVGPFEDVFGDTMAGAWKVPEREGPGGWLALNGQELVTVECEDCGDESARVRFNDLGLVAEAYCQLCFEERVAYDEEQEAGRP